LVQDAVLQGAEIFLVSRAQYYELEEGLGGAASRLEPDVPVLTGEVSSAPLCLSDIID